MSGTLRALINHLCLHTGLQSDKWLGCQNIQVPNTHTHSIILRIFTVRRLWLIVVLPGKLAILKELLHLLVGWKALTRDDMTSVSGHWQRSNRVEAKGGSGIDKQEMVALHCSLTAHCQYPAGGQNWGFFSPFSSSSFVQCVSPEDSARPSTTGKASHSPTAVPVCLSVPLEHCCLPWFSAFPQCWRAVPLPLAAARYSCCFCCC